MTEPSFEYEQDLWNKGIQYVGGCDEVGRGCLAGPVVAACVGFSSEINIPQGIHINDSKLLTQKRRNEASIWIKDNALFWGIGETSVGEINTSGIVSAIGSAVRISVENAEKVLSSKFKMPIDFVLLDAFTVPELSKKKKQKAIPKGDTKSVSIAAASIIAKVYRDSLMEKLAATNKNYFWEKNKGYGTRLHREALMKYGPTKHHREQFVRTAIANYSNS